MRDRLIPFLARISRKRSTGLVIDDEAITVSRVIHTALGPVEYRRHREDMGQDSLDNVLRRALRPVFERKEWKAAPIAVGLPTLRFLFTNRPLNAMNREANGETLLHESLQLTNILIDDLAIDTLRTLSARGGTATIVAARKRYLEPVLESLTAAGVRPFTVEPAVFGLLRVAAQDHPTPRRVRSVYRAFLGATGGTLILVNRDRPVAWRGFPLPAGREAEALVAAVGPLRALAPRYGEEAAPTLLLIHGRTELAALATAPAWKSWGIEVAHRDKPAIDDGDAAYGAAVGCQLEDEGFNLARALRPQQSFVSIFPWGQAAVQASVLASATSLLAGQLYDLRTRVNVQAIRAERHTWLGRKTVAQLETERKELATRAELIHSFLATRFQWANYTREVAARLPASMGIVSLSGKSTYVAPGAKGTPVQNLTLQVEAPIPAGTSVPADINLLMDNLRATPLLKRNLPLITMSELKWVASRDQGGTTASFSLVCSPPAKPKGKSAGSKKPAKA